MFRSLYISSAVALVWVGLFLPIAFTSAQAPTAQPPSNAGFARQGIFGCNAGNQALSPGAFQATQGVYVPVNDAAVTLNTAILVYKECVLDGLQTRLRESATASLVNQQSKFITSGRDGKPLFLQNIEEYARDRANIAATEFVTKDYNTSELCEPVRRDVQVRAARRYLFDQRPQNRFACTTERAAADQQAFYQDFSRGGWQTLWETVSGPNYPLAAEGAFRGALHDSVEREVSSSLTYADWANGFLPITEVAQESTEGGGTRRVERVVTPGYLVSETMVQYTGSGFRQLESATEIDQIINSLFSSIGNQIISGVRGLVGVTQATSGQAPYVDRVVQEAQAGVRGAAANTALAVLQTAIQAETAYNNAKKSALSSLEGVGGQLRQAEAQCWNLLVPAVEQAAIDANCQTVTTTDPNTGQTSTSQQCSAPVPLSITLQNIAGGTVELQTTSAPPPAPSATAQLSVATTSAPIQGGTLSLTTTPGATFTPNDTLTMAVSSAPITEGSATTQVTPSAPFTAGEFSLSVTPRAYIPQPSVTLNLNPAQPFGVGEVQLDLEAVWPFAKDVIDSSVAPLQGALAPDIQASDQALAELQQLVQDVTNSSSQNVQRLALERLDALVASGAIHTAFDARDAQQQSQDVQSTANTLVEDTVNQWGSGSGWCNAENPQVVDMWLGRWRTN